RELPECYGIDRLEQRIAWRFVPSHARVWFDRALEVFRVGKIDVSKLKIRWTAAHSLDQSECAAIEIVTRNDVRAALEQLKHCSHRGETGCECETACPAFQIGDALFVCEPGGIDRARVIVAVMLARAFLHISRRRIDWRHHC